MARVASHKAPHEATDRTAAVRVPFRERLSCSIAEAAEATGLDRATIYRRIKDGDLATRKVGVRNLVLLPSLLRLIEGAPEGQPPGGQP